MSNRARIHECAGLIAIKLGDGPTQYITPALAEKLGAHLGPIALQVRNGYHQETVEIET